MSLWRVQRDAGPWGIVSEYRFPFMAWIAGEIWYWRHRIRRWWKLPFRDDYIENHAWRFRLITTNPGGKYRGQSALQWRIFGVEPPLYRTLLPLSKSMPGRRWFSNLGFKIEDYKIT